MVGINIGINFVEPYRIILSRNTNRDLHKIIRRQRGNEETCKSL